MDRRALEWEARGFASLRAELAAWRDHTEAHGPAVQAMALRGWPEQTRLLVEYVFEEDARTKDMDLWYGDFLSPPRGERIGDHEMIATIGWSEFLEDTLRAVAVPNPPTTYPDLDWEHAVFEDVRLELALRNFSSARWATLLNMGLRGWPRETEFFAKVEGKGPTRSRSWPIWNPDFHLPAGPLPGDPEATATMLWAAILPM
jgi:hypothetical protein